MAVLRRIIIASGLAAATLAAAALAGRPAADSPRAAASTAPALRDGKAGVAAWQRGDYAAALAIWRPLAAAGDAEAQFNIGQAYRLGRGVAQDEAAAMIWYERAARQGLTQAEANYGLLLLQKDRAAALPWLVKASEKGDPRAQYVVATALFNGDPSPADPVRAYALMSRAAAAGLPQAMRSLGEMEGYLSADQRQRGLALAETLSGRPVQTAVPAPAAAPAARGEAAPSIATGGRWRIQLGAFADAARAEALWRTVSVGRADLADKQSYLVKAGAVTRLQAGPFATRAAAERACAAVRGGSNACFAIIAP